MSAWTWEHSIVISEGRRDARRFKFRMYEYAPSPNTANVGVSSGEEQIVVRVVISGLLTITSEYVE